MTTFPLPNDAALDILAKLSARPSKSERLLQMRIDAQEADRSAERLQERNLAELEAMTSQMATSPSRRVAAGRDRATEREEDREQAFEMLRRRQEFTREQQQQKQAFTIQQAGQRLRGSGMRPGQQRLAGPRPTQRAIVTGPEGMLISRGGGPTERVEGFSEQLAAARGMGEEARFLGPELRPRLVRGDRPGFARVTPQPSQSDPLSSIIMDSEMSEPDKIEMARVADSVGRKGGLTMNQFLEQIEDREPVQLSAEDYRVKRDRAIAAYSRIEDRSTDEAKMLADSIDYYEQKMMGRPRTRYNPTAFRTVDQGPGNELNDTELERAMDQTGGDVEAAIKLLQGR